MFFEMASVTRSKSRDSRKASEFSDSTTSGVNQENQAMHSVHPTHQTGMKKRTLSPTSGSLVEIAPRRKRKRTGVCSSNTPTLLASAWTRRSWFGMIRAIVLCIIVAGGLFVMHHQLQVMYYQTCRANLLTVVLHNRSDMCHGLSIAISAIERGYHQGLVTIMHWGASAAALLLPCMFAREPPRPPPPIPEHE